MRLNRFLAQLPGLSRRKADQLIASGLVLVNGQVANLGSAVQIGDQVSVDGSVYKVEESQKATVVILNKPTGYVCSRDGQGSPTVYDLLPQQLKNLKIAGRLDKDSSGLVLLTDSGDLLNELTHPSHQKQKSYHITTLQPLSDADLHKINTGVKLADGISHMFIKPGTTKGYDIQMGEGRNRQIRRTIDVLNNRVVTLHRLQLGRYKLGELSEKEFKVVDSAEA